jgi:hypothetical protein
MMDEDIKFRGTVSKFNTRLIINIPKAVQFEFEPLKGHKIMVSVSSADNIDVNLSGPDNLCLICGSVLSEQPCIIYKDFMRHGHLGKIYMKICADHTDADKAKAAEIADEVFTLYAKMLTQNYA